MHQFYHPKFQKEMFTIDPGEFFSSSEDLIINTLLGSCISVVLVDIKQKQSGMNHFLLPGKIDNTKYYLSYSGRYGMNAMEYLINDLLKKGSSKKDLSAKVFGGAMVLKMRGPDIYNIAENNIKFAFEYLDLEGIPIESFDTGGNIGRKIFLFPKSGKVLLQRINQLNESKLKSEIVKEKKYYNLLFESLNSNK